MRNFPNQRQTPRKAYRKSVPTGPGPHGFKRQGSCRVLLISVCDDYSLPIDFVKKRPSSFDPCLVQHIPTNWASPSPQSEHQEASRSIAEGTHSNGNAKFWRS
uniref:Uncharacterized protein n=1 Tax=Anopheles quadriannulatus TaxID=34691 RepID=A0A182WYD7_ANOQN